MKRAEDDYEGFWEDAAIAAMDDIYWFKEWDTVLEWNYPTFKLVQWRADQHVLQLR